MDIRFLAGSATSVIAGLYMISASGAQTLVPMPTGPYQSQSRPVLVGMPEPAKSLLGIGGTLIAIGGGLGCLYKGLEEKQIGPLEAEVGELEEIDYEDPIPVAHRVPVVVGAREGQVFDTVRDTRSINPSTNSVNPSRSLSKVQYSHKGTLTEKKSLLDEYEDPLLCSKMARSNKSIIICSPPGTGKSTLVEGFVAELFRNKPNSELHIVDQKGKLWLGLGKIPDLVVIPTRDDFDPLVEKLANAASTLMDRIDESRERRVRGLPDTHYHPYWLILDDYLSLYDNFPNVLEAKVANKVMSDLKYVITVGREYNVMALIITHSPNVGEIGLSDPVRKAAGIITLGRIDPQRDDGGFMAIWDMISKANIVTSKPMRDGLQETMRVVEPYCIANKRSAFFSTMGQVRIGIVPDLSWVSGYQLDIAIPDEGGLGEAEPEDPYEADATPYTANEPDVIIDPWGEGSGAPSNIGDTDWSNAI